MHFLPISACAIGLKSQLAGRKWRRRTPSGDWYRRKRDRQLHTTAGRV